MLVSALEVPTNCIVLELRFLPSWHCIATILKPISMTFILMY